MEDAYFHTNARHPIEEEISATCRRLIAREGVRWPGERLQLRIEFGLKRRTVSSHSLQAVRFDERRHARGNVRMFFNTLFLLQHPDVSWTSLVPHQFAHVISDLKARSESRKLEKPHGEEWEAEYQRICGDAPPPKQHESLVELLDDRPIEYIAGDGQAARCVCEGDDGFHMVPARSKTKLTTGQMRCPHCQAAMKPVDEVPLSIRQVADVLKAYEITLGSAE